MTNKNALILVNSGELCDAIEAEMIRLNRNITNEEVQNLLWKLVDDKKAKFIGTTNLDGDLISGNLREQGIIVRNLNEERRTDEKTA